MSAPRNTQPDRPDSSANPSTDPGSNLPVDEGIVAKDEPIITALFGTAPPPLNDNLEQRVEVHADHGHWQSTRVSGLSICVLEYIDGNNPRMTALFKLEEDEHAGARVQIPANDLELLVQHGLVADDDTEYLHPYYIRQPTDLTGNNQHFTLYPGSKNKLAQRGHLEFYVATGQLAATDKQRRCINLNDHSLWLPGPVENTEVMPLHMHQGNNSMLVRWLDTASFKPRLDPMGEEVLVISGTLTDKYGTYTTGSWIRNPVRTWQTWGGKPGTLIYYKNGHFGS